MKIDRNTPTAFTQNSIGNNFQADLTGDGKKASETINAAGPTSYTMKIYGSVSMDKFNELWTERSKRQSQGYHTAGSAISAIKKELANVNSALHRKLPNLKPTDWDFSLKDGKLVATGKLDDESAKAVTEALNSDTLLVKAVNTLSQAATTDLETSEKNPTVYCMNLYSGRMENRTFYNVANQLENVSFKDVLSKTNRYMTANNYQPPESAFGYGVMDVISTMLKASPPRSDEGSSYYDQPVRYV